MIIGSDIKQLHRVQVFMPNAAEPFVLFVPMTYDQQMSAKMRLQNLMNSGRIKFFFISTRFPGWVEFTHFDSVIKEIEEMK